MSTFLYLSDGYLAAMGLWLVALTVAPVAIMRWRRQRRTTGKPLRLVHAGLMLWLLLGLLTLPELYCALFYDTTDSFGLTNVSLRWHEMHVTTNADGFRDDHPLSKTLNPDRQRICFIGDSFTFGHGVPDVADRFTERIATDLESIQPGRYRVANAGLPGLDVRKLVDGFLPDLIKRDVQIDVLVYTLVLNDIEYYEEQTGKLYQDIEQLKPRFFLFRDTYFYNLAYFRWQQLQQPRVRNYFSYLSESYRTEPWNRMQRKLDQLVAVCDANDIELRVVIFPFLHNLGTDYPFRDAHRRLQDYFEAQSVLCLDLEPILTQHVDDGLTVNRFDAHPNERAHELAAEAMSERLLADLFESAETK
ncbi:MAG: SGNH/GDSL hydrolase family protein [Planctomycetaceae bacterium]|jgi:hypothetical protein|nr:SGNH/GDSL hydrolase family protein [Planctomycetaceae bacterium]MBT6153462.1 SGNH/GDSL hydrolase family protein [Planctomycetaceae bacterium]MBT6484706.1 SGNH/GDSL hydrolase family protein [Planctomycetaceae bacterium]MBT6496456.1 SGNH/GDSL hydrolase family protein [Planctomycetaceae bacterium]